MISLGPVAVVILGLAVIGVLSLLGLVLVGVAWRWTSNHGVIASRTEILASIGIGLVTGGVLAAAGFWLQYQYSESLKELTWRNGVQTSSDLAGLDVHGHQLFDPDLDFSGKTISAANFDNVRAAGLQFRNTDATFAYFRSTDLEGARFPNAVLHSAHLTGAKLRKAVLTTADLSGADLRDADLSGADLRFANFTQADIRRANLNQARVNSQTCWPEGFLSSTDPAVVKQRAGLAPVRPGTKNDTGAEWPDCRGGASGISTTPEITHCTEDELIVSLTEPLPDGGGIDVRLTNTAGNACSVRYYGVLNFFAHGVRLPVVANPQARNNQTIELAAGQTAITKLRWKATGCENPGPRGKPDTVTIRPIDTRFALKAPWTGGPICDDQVDQWPFTASSLPTASP